MIVAEDVRIHAESLLERLRPLVGFTNWDYCVLWKLSEDQRFIEWTGCCCGGAESTQNGEEHNFPISPNFPCRDVAFQHPRTKSCGFLAQLPFSMPLDSGIHGHALKSSQPRWLNQSVSADSSASIETAGTKVLIPVMEGLVELFVAKHVSEDQQIIDFVVAQSNFLRGHDPTTAPIKINSSFSEQLPVLGPEMKGVPAKVMNQLQSLTIADNSNSLWDPSTEQIHLCNSPMNLLRGSAQQHPTLHSPPGLSSVNKEHGRENDLVKQQTGRADSVSGCSDQIEDEEDEKWSAKNLEAERKRRKKLTERLYILRSLVPKITKLDKASILGDAIEFIRELQKQVKELAKELEDPPDEDNAKNSSGSNNENNLLSDTLNHNGISLRAHSNRDEAFKGQQVGIMDTGTRIIDSLKQNHNHNLAITHEKEQQMEVQVEVSQIDGNEFFLKVFCEHKPGGFVRLMEALNSLGLEVTNASITTFRGLVLNVFRVERRDSEMVQADNVRDSLLELTRNPIGVRPEPARASEIRNNMDYRHNHHRRHRRRHSRRVVAKWFLRQLEPIPENDIEDTICDDINNG